MRNLNLFIMKCISIYFVTLLLLMSGCESGRRFILKDLRCENLENPVAIDNTHPHFSWKIETDGQTMRQAYFEIQVATDSSLLAQGKADLWNSGKVESSASVMVPYRGKELRSSVLAYWKVRVWDDKGESSDWSPINRFGIGLLDKAEWQGKYIGMPDEKNPMLRNKFELQDRDATFKWEEGIGRCSLACGISIKQKIIIGDVRSYAVRKAGNKRLIALVGPWLVQKSYF